MTDTSAPSPRPVSPGHPLAWIWLTLLAILVIEGATALLHRSSPFERTNFLDYRFDHPPDPSRLLFDAKMRELSGSRPTILMVGDSSGFHGVHPPVVEALLPGTRMVNMDIFAFGYPGYLAAMRAMLDRNPSIKVVALYVTLVALPAPGFVDDSSSMGLDIDKAFVSPVYGLTHLPSLGFRRAVADAVFLGTAGTNAASIAESLKRYPDALRLIPQTSGWVREHDAPDDLSRGPLDAFRKLAKFGPETPDQEVIRIFGKDYATMPQVFDWRRLRTVDLTETTFDAFRDLATASGVKLVISLAPLAEVYRNSDVASRVEAFNRYLADYQTRHPEVGVVPITYWPDERFSSTEHITTAWTVANSVRFGTALRDVLGDVAALKADDPAGQDRIRVDTVALDHAAPVYGFGPPVVRDGGVARALRDGRDEGLVYANARPNVREVVLEPASGVPDDLLAAVSVSVFGEACERLPDDLQQGRRRLVFRLPASSLQYDGWLELLISTRGSTTWPGHGLRADARGPELALRTIVFR